MENPFSYDPRRYGKSSLVAELTFSTARWKLMVALAPPSAVNRSV